MNNSILLENELTAQLDHFDLDMRQYALATLCQMVDDGKAQTTKQQEIINLHCHSFFSYNGYGYSPTHLAWLGRKQGIQFMGVVDFDVLDAVDEFLDACEIAGIRGTAGIETRVFIPEFSDVEINSPGEPGVAYHMGTGFTTSRVSGDALTAMRTLRERAAERNQNMLVRINQFLAPLVIDYTADVLPLTPAGNATERHIVQVLAEKAERTLPDPAAFWAEKLKMDQDEIALLMPDTNRMQDLLRTKLMKRGSIGYVQPTPDSFPTVEELHAVVETCGALPCCAWLDGTSPGEQRMEELLHLLVGKGVRAINIVPDRNWNISNPDDKKVKLANLYQIVEIAQQLDLPVLVGTEMNKFGQKMVDDFDAPELQPVKSAFIKGAYMIYGHTQLARYWNIGYQSAWADAHFKQRKARNDFYEEAGKLIPPGKKTAAEDLLQFSPQEVLTYLEKH